MLSSFTKYDKLANPKHADSKKLLFARGVYRVTPGSVATYSPNNIGGWREAGEEAGREAEREAGGEAGGRVEREAGGTAGGERETLGWGRVGSVCRGWERGRGKQAGGEAEREAV